MATGFGLITGSIIGAWLVWVGIKGTLSGSPALRETKEGAAAWGAVPAPSARS
jgi:hypothetical protein